MFRKVIATATASVLIALAFSVAPASAATKISNGVPCSKINAVKKVSGFNYRCSTNALVKNSKLTWLSFECLSSIKQFQSAVKAQGQLTNSADQIKALNAQFESATVSLAVVTAALETATAQAKDYRSKMNTTTNAAEKQSLALAVAKLADAVLKLSGAKTRLSSQVRSLEKERAVLLTAPQQLKTAASDARGSAQLLCSKGF
jgi:chromosome segregation ATPase